MGKIMDQNGRMGLTINYASVFGWIHKTQLCFRFSQLCETVICVFILPPIWVVCNLYKKLVLNLYKNMAFIVRLEYIMNRACGLLVKLYFCAAFAWFFRPVVPFWKFHFVHASTNATDDLKYSPLPSADFDSSAVLVSFSTFIFS